MSQIERIRQLPTRDRLQRRGASSVVPIGKTAASAPERPMIRLLRVLIDSGGRRDDLAREAALTREDTGVLLDRLVDAGWVAHPGAGRTPSYVLTESGRRRCRAFNLTTASVPPIPSSEPERLSFVRLY